MTRTLVLSILFRAGHRHHVLLHKPVMLPAFVLGTLAADAATFYGVERPVLRLRDRISAVRLRRLVGAELATSNGRAG